jgi:hypothetical protein
MGPLPRGGALALLASCGRIGFATVDRGDALILPDAPPCYAIEDHFDGPALDTQWNPYAVGGASTPTIVGGALVLDVPAPVSGTGISRNNIDLHAAVATMTVRGFTFVTGTQVFFEIYQSGVGLQRTTQLAIGPDLMAARLQTAPNMYDDNQAMVTATLPAFRLQMAISPGSSGTDIVWRYSLSETDPFVDLRTANVPYTLEVATFNAEYQVFLAAATDPPPIEIDDVTIVVPCP